MKMKLFVLLGVFIHTSNQAYKNIFTGSTDLDEQPQEKKQDDLYERDQPQRSPPQSRPRPQPTREYDDYDRRYDDREDDRRQPQREQSQRSSESQRNKFGQNLQNDDGQQNRAKGLFSKSGGGSQQMQSLMKGDSGSQLNGLFNKFQGGGGQDKLQSLLGGGNQDKLQSLLGGGGQDKLQSLLGGGGQDKLQSLLGGQGGKGGLFAQLQSGGGQDKLQSLLGGGGQDKLQSLLGGGGQDKLQSLLGGQGGGAGNLLQNLQSGNTGGLQNALKGMQGSEQQKQLGGLFSKLRGSSQTSKPNKQKNETKDENEEMKNALSKLFDAEDDLDQLIKEDKLSDDQFVNQFQQQLNANGLQIPQNQMQQFRGLGNSQGCNCSQNLSIVCGANGKTYTNECIASCEKVSIAKKGPCLNVGSSLGDINSLISKQSSGSYLGASKDCNSCSQKIEPVCGKDNKLYKNMCQMECQGVSLKKLGTC